MRQFQPKVACIVLQFTPKPRAGAYLTSLDRLEINRWRERARLSGFDRMVIHDRESGDYAEMGNILCLYQAGQAWSRWAFARQGGVVHAWCSLTGVDVGVFPSLAAAFRAVMPGPVGMSEGPANAADSGVVTDFMPRLRRASGTR